MEIRPSLLIPTMVKAMTEVVLPAVDPENKLAVEQARLVVGILQLLSQRLPLLDRYDRVELHDYVDLAGRLAGATRGGATTTRAVEEMVASRNEAERLLADPKVNAPELERQLLELREKVSRLVIAAHEDGEMPGRASIRRAVIEASRAETARARAWVLPQGWEANIAVPPIESLLSAERRDGRRKGDSDE